MNDVLENAIRDAFRLEIQWLEDHEPDGFLKDENGVETVTVEQFLDGKIKAINERLGTQ